MSAADTRAVLVCRLECPEELLEGLDGWMPKHFDDSLTHPAFSAAANYAIARDYTRLPTVLNGHGNRFIVYVMDDVGQLEQWLDSEQARAAIDDGADREGRYPPLDGEPFTGNIYLVRQVWQPLGRDFAGRGPLLVERFEVPPNELAEFDAWLDGDHLEAVSHWPGVVRARTWRQMRDELPQRFPFDRYSSKGNRMLWVDFEDATDIRAIAAEGVFDDALADSLRWDLRLRYIRRELCEFLMVRTSEDAAAEEAGRARH